MKILFVFAFILFNFTITHSLNKSSNYSSKTLDIDEDNDPYLRVRRIWISSDKGLKKAMGRIIKSYLPSLMREVYTRNISSGCLSSLLQVTNALKKGKLWPFKMLDASGKLPEGFLSGTLTLLGDYKECINIDVKDAKFQTQGQYCSIDVIPPRPVWRPFMSVHLRVPELENISEPDSLITHLTSFVHNLHVTNLKMGVCVPSQCTLDDINNIIQFIPEYTGINWEFEGQRCEVKTETIYTSTQIIVLYILGTLVFFVLLGSIMDIFFKADDISYDGLKGTIFHVLHAFSFPANARKLANYSCPEEKLRFVHGAMYMSLIWITISNTFVYVNYDVSSNILHGIHLMLKLAYQILENRLVPIQTFFFLNGFISAYQLIKHPNKPFCFWKYIIKRYLRYTPTYILVLLVVMLITTWGSGPTWYDHIQPIYTKCTTKWWANILYINNFIDYNVACLEHLWIFAIDAQLHIIGIFVLIPLQKKPKIGLMVNFMLMVGGLLTVAFTNVFYELPPNEMIVFLGPRDQAYYGENSYLRVYTHLCVYCAGIATGYLMAEKPKFKISRCNTWLAGIVAISAALATVTSVNEWSMGILPSPLIGALYAALGKLAWALFLSWVTVSCMSGRGGILNDFLSWQPFVFLSKLVFIAYMVHPVIITVAMAFQKAHLFIEDFQILYIIVSHTGGSCLVAYIFYIGFEAPFLSLADVFKKKIENRNTDFTGDNEACSSNNICNSVLSEKPVNYNSNQSDNVVQIRTKF